MIETKLQWHKPSEKKPPAEEWVLGLIVRIHGSYLEPVRWCLKNRYIGQIDYLCRDHWENEEEEPFDNEPLLWTDPNVNLDELIGLATGKVIDPRIKTKPQSIRYPR